MNYLFSQISAFNCCLKSYVTKDGHPLCSLSCTLALPSLINQHISSHFSPSFIAPLPYTSTICLCISAGQTFLPFKIPITDHTLQVARSSFFTFIFGIYREWGKNKTLYYAIHVFPLTWRRQLSITESVQVTCMAAICYRFLHSDVPRIISAYTG